MSRGRIEIVHGDAGEQHWHVRLAAQSTEPISASEQLGKRQSAVENVLAQARTFGYDTPHVVLLNPSVSKGCEGDVYLLWSGLSIAGMPLPRERVIAEITVVEQSDVDLDTLRTKLSGS